MLPAIFKESGAMMKIVRGYPLLQGSLLFFTPGIIKMMESVYSIIVNMRVHHGYVETAHFFIMGTKSDSLEIFDQLYGQYNSDITPLLRMDLVARDSNGIDTVLNSLDCTLQELTENIKIITKETFKLLNLEQ
jgi:hypothetical protein